MDAGDFIVMPGFVNAHQHTWQTGIRGVAGDWTLVEYIRQMHEGFGPRFGPEDIYLANLVGALNQLNGGVTTLFDWCHNNPTPEHTDAGLDGLEEAGIRAVFGHGTPKPRIAEGETPLSHRTASPRRGETPALGAAGFGRRPHQAGPGHERPRSLYARYVRARYLPCP